MALASAIVWQHVTSQAARPSQPQRTESARSSTALRSSLERPSAGPSSNELPSLEAAESFASSRRTVSRDASPVRAAPLPPAGVENGRAQVANAPHVPQTVLPVAPTVAGMPSSHTSRKGRVVLAARRGGELDEPVPDDVLGRDAEALGALADIFAGDAVRAVVSATRRPAHPMPPSRR
jgi:hypothetical protein